MEDRFLFHQPSSTTHFIKTTRYHSKVVDFYTATMNQGQAAPAGQKDDYVDKGSLIVELIEAYR